MTNPLPPPDHGGLSITIGLRDLYDQMQVIAAGYTSLSAKLDTTLISQTLAQQSTATQLADLRSDLADHEARMRAQESRQIITPRSMWAAVGVLAGALGTAVAIIQSFGGPPGQ